MAVAILSYFRTLLAAIHRDERAQDVFEYLLVIGGVSVAVIFIIATPVGETMIGAVISGVCDAMATVVDTLDCSGV